MNIENYLIHINANFLLNFFKIFKSIAFYDDISVINEILKLIIVMKKAIKFAKINL